MTKLIWDVNPKYELGIDRGVLFTSYDNGVVWNGLNSVNENILGSERNERYIDGVKYMEDLGGKVYQATIKAYTVPFEFNACLGMVDVVPGFTLTNQTKKRFHLCYRTLIADIGYKIHIVYNLTAGDGTPGFKSLSGKTVDPSVIDIKVDAVPPPSTRFKPTSHFVIDSTKTPKATLDLVEAMLYGTTNAAPSLPTSDQLLTLFKV